MTTLIHTDSAKSGKPVNGQIKNVKDTSQKTYKNLTSKKQKNNEPVCPFLCPHCNTLGPEYLKSRYEPKCMISDSWNNIFFPMYERYDDKNKDSVRDKRFFLPTIVGFEQ